MIVQVSRVIVDWCGLGCSLMRKSSLWYTRSGDEIHGPFPAAVISQYLLLGRLSRSDEVSQNQEAWYSIDKVKELIPDVMKADLSDSFNKERLEAAKRWADERFATDRRDDKDNPNEIDDRRDGGRRLPEDEDVVDHRQIKLRRSYHSKSEESSNWPALVAILAVIGGLVFLAVKLAPEQVEIVQDCLAEPSPGIDWNNCRRQGASLNGANLEQAKIRNADFSGGSLQNANLSQADMAFTNFSLADMRQANMQKSLLMGASFHGADLRWANLRGADLSYVDFFGAKLEGANFAGAKLDKAIWVDKSICAVGSVGQCVPMGK